MAAAAGWRPRIEARAAGARCRAAREESAAWRLDRLVDRLGDGEPDAAPGAQGHRRQSGRSLARHGRLQRRSRCARQSRTCVAARRRDAGDVPLAAQARHPLLRADAGAAAHKAAHAQRAAQFARLHHASRESRAARRRRHRLRRARHRAGGGAGPRGRRRLRDGGRPAALSRARRRGAGDRRFHQRSRAEGALHGAAGGQDRRRQRDRDRRRPEAGACARRPHHQRRSRARPGAAFRAAARAQHAADAAAVARCWPT